MNTTKTIILLTPGFPADETDTTCLPFIQLFVKSCKAHEPALKIIVLSFQYPFKSASYLWHDISVKSFNGRNRGKFNRLMVWVKVWKSMQEIQKENKVAGILSLWLGECAFIGTYFARKKNLPHFTWILGQDAKKGNRYQRLIKPDPKDLVALSNSLSREYLKNYGAKPGYIIPVGIDTSLFSPETPARDIDVLGAGSLIPLKRYDLFIEVIQRLVTSIPTLRSVICGKGIEKANLLRLVQQYRLQDNISILDELPHQEVLRLMQRSKVFLHTSAYEGYAVVCAEAQYAGAHVVSFCKPMEKGNPQEHIVETKEEAADKTLQILDDKTRTHQSLLHHSIEDISMQMMKLFML